MKFQLCLLFSLLPLSCFAASDIAFARIDAVHPASSSSSSSSLLSLSSSARRSAKSTTVFGHREFFSDSDGSGTAVTTPLTCALPNNDLSQFCPSPPWRPNYNLTLATVCQPGSSSDYFLPPLDQPWGLVSLDWSVAMSVWRHSNMNESTCEATSIHGCQLIKQRFPSSRCFIYHNMELALQAQESNRVVMYDESKAHWFLQYTDGKGRKNGTVYNEPDTPGDQFFWDFRVAEAADYYIDTVLQTVSDVDVDGTFTDDVTGLPEEHPLAMSRMNLTASEVVAVQQATQRTSQRLISLLLESGKYNWQAFGFEDVVGPAVTQSTCTSFLRSLCNFTDTSPSRVFTMQFDPNFAEQSVAAFLIARTPVAYLGFGWESDQRNWHPLFLLNVGEPRTGCVEKPGTTAVFQREWSQGVVELDCNTFKPTIPDTMFD